MSENPVCPGRKALIFLFAAGDDKAAVLEHNLSIADAVNETRCMRRKGLPAYYALQAGGHSGSAAENCPACGRIQELLVFGPSDDSR